LNPSSVRTAVPERLLAIVQQIDAEGAANLTRLTVLKSWFKRRGRLPALAIWVARSATALKGKTSGAAGELFREARRLLTDADKLRPVLDRTAAQALHDRLAGFQDEWQNQQWGPVRIVRNWNLLVIEEGLSIYLHHPDSAPLGYKLVADYCQHYDSRHGNCLCGPSRTKLIELTRFMFTVEAREAIEA
jgi:hypothetical protein